MANQDTSIERAAEKLGGLLLFGLMLNGCLSSVGQRSIHESMIVDEQKIADAIVEAGCLQSGRQWKFDKCIPDEGR